MMRIATRSVFFLLVAFILVLPAAAQGGGGGDELAVRSASDARELIAEGRLDEARVLVENARNLSPDSSDILYLAALLSLQSSNRAEAASLIEHALAADSFSAVPKRDAVVLLSGLYLSLGKASSSVSLLEPFRARFLSDPDLAYAAVAAYFRAGNAGSYLGLLDSCLSAYPEDPRFPEFYLSGLPRRTASGPDLARVALIESRKETLKKADPGILLSLLPFVPTVQDKKKLLLEYWDSGGDEPSSYVEGLDSGLLTAPEASSRFFKGRTRLSLNDIARLYGLVATDAERARFESAFATFTGVATGPVPSRSPAGTVVSSYYDKGRLLRWSLDRGRGRIEAAADFSDGLPSKVELLSPDRTVTIDYDRYPVVRSATVVTPAGSTLYRPAPSSLSYPVLVIDRLANAPVPPVSATSGSSGNPDRAMPVSVAFDAGLPEPTDRYLAASSSSIEERPSASGVTTVTILDSGIPVSGREMEEGRVTAFIIYEKGLVAEKRIDTDRDGSFETTEFYKEGRLSERRVAPIQGDGYREVHEGRRVTKYWDFDGDGLTDYTETK
jgi:tetratricopeptide (TPR) repeat protein